MTTFTFTKATKEQAKLRLALFGPSGSGKTYTALSLATGMGGKTAVIDTERGSASKYADRFAFDVLDLPEKDIPTYVAAITAAQKAGYENLIIDSLSHGWFELLAEVEKIARAKYRGNTWSAWSEGTPKQRKLVDAILDFDGHVIATMRVKTDWVLEQTKGGKNRPVRVGLAPQQGKGIEYEFDVLGELSIDHVLSITKDRTGRFQDRIFDKPGEELGQELIAWLKEGAKPKARKKKAAPKKAEQKPDDGLSDGLPPLPNDLTSEQRIAFQYETKEGDELRTIPTGKLEEMAVAIDALEEKSIRIQAMSKMIAAVVGWRDDNQDAAAAYWTLMQEAIND